MMMSTWHVLGWIVLRLLFCLLVELVTAISLWQVRKRAAPRETPWEIAIRRYAKGEISRAEFENLRRVVEAPPAKPVHFAG